MKARTAPIIQGIRKEHERQLAALREKQNAERENLSSRHSEQSQEQAREIREGRDRQVYRQERRDKRGLELEETKRDILKEPAERKPRRVSLSDKFQQVTTVAKAEKDHDHATRSEPQGRQPQPRQEKRDAHDRAAAFRDQAKDVTEKRETSKSRGGLSEKFTRAKEAKPAEKATSPKQSIFKDNAGDISRKTGRGRNITPKPPGGRKPT